MRIKYLTHTLQKILNLFYLNCVLEITTIIYDIEFKEITIKGEFCNTNMTICKEFEITCDKKLIGKRFLSGLFYQYLIHTLV